MFTMLKDVRGWKVNVAKYGNPVKPKHAGKRGIFRVSFSASDCIEDKEYLAIAQGEVIENRSENYGKETLASKRTGTYEELPHLIEYLVPLG